MRKFGWLAASIVFCAPVISNADFIINHTRADGTGSLTGYSVYKFYALNTQSGQHPTSTTLAGVDFIIQSLGQPFKLGAYDVNSDGTDDININGYGMTDSTATATFVRIGSDPAKALSFGFPVATADFISKPGYDPVAHYAGATSFHVVTASTPDNRPNATTSLGSRFAVVIVPTGSSVRLTGQVADELGISGAADSAEMNLPDSGTETTVTPTPGYFQIPEYIALAPEPGSLALLGVATAGLCRRSRRNK